jgi:hypothetical protein
MRQQQGVLLDAATRHEQKAAEVKCAITLLEHH